MVIDEIIHQFHSDAEQLIPFVAAEPDKHRAAELQAKAQMQYHLARDMNAAVRYWLDIKQIERFRGARFHHEAFPPLIHDKLFVEFNGVLTFNFRPWQRPDLFLAEDRQPISVGTLKPRAFSDHIPTGYKAVFILRYDPPHIYINWPQEPVIRIWWFEKPLWAAIPGRNGAFPLADNYTLTFCKSSWPRVMDVFDVRPMDEAEHPGENAHADRLFATTVNLMYFLAAENVIRVRIRPEHHQRHDLKGLPKSDREYHVLPFQLPRYRYLHPENGQPTGRHVSVCFDVRGHFRHLLNDRYERNPDGTARVIFINSHQRGLDNPYRPAVRRGSIDSLFLDYDKFIREEEARVRRARTRKEKA
jgi:hypothetical protein